MDIDQMMVMANKYADDANFYKQGLERVLKEREDELELIEAFNEESPFKTDGCPDVEGEVGCTRPYGSYRPTETFRDYPFTPEQNDLAQIREEMKLEEILQK